MNHSDFKGYKPTQKQAHLQTEQGKNASQSLQKSLLCQRTTKQTQNDNEQTRQKGRAKC
jgi:hypothetical protein